MIQVVTPPDPAVEMVRPKPVVNPPAPKMAPAEVRKKLPAYAKPLLLNRTGGFHPARALLVFGDDWRLPNTTKKNEAAARADGVTPYTKEWLQRCGWPCLAVRPAEFVRGALDWRLLAGLWVHVLDQTPGEWLPDAPRFWLAAEIAEFAADVELEYPGVNWSIADVAYWFRTAHPTLPYGFVPDWWSVKLQEINVNNAQKWISNPARLDKPAAREW